MWWVYPCDPSTWLRQEDGCKLEAFLGCKRDHKTNKTKPKTNTPPSPKLYILPTWGPDSC